jgi:hypothetical protein
MSRAVHCDARPAAGEWEAHRVPLVEEIRTTKDSVAKRKSDMKYKLDRIKQMREDMKRLAVEIREKDELVKQLLEELGKLPKQVQRTGYTRRIMDIMKNIEKQQITISGILKDTRDTQKDINTVSEVLRRFLSLYCFLLHFPPPASPLQLAAPHRGFDRYLAAPTLLRTTWCSALPKRKMTTLLASDRACPCTPKP